MEIFQPANYDDDTNYVVGPASATNNDIVVFDNTTGKLIKDSGILISAIELSANLDTDVGSLGYIKTVGTSTKSFVHKYPVSTAKHIIQKVESAYTITSLDIFVKGGTSITGRLVEYDTDGTLIQVISADITATAGVDSVTTSFTHAVVASSKKIGWEVTAVSGAVEEISVTYNFTK